MRTIKSPLFPLFFCILVEKNRQQHWKLEKEEGEKEKGKGAILKQAN